MFEMSYEGKSYNYGEVGSQNYDIKTQVKITEENASPVDIIEAIAKLMNIATYTVTVDTIRKACDELEEEYGGNRII